MSDQPKVRYVPAQHTRAEIRVVNSRFIAALAPAFSVADAREFIQEQREAFQDATHHVPLYVIGHGASVTAHCSDDGEPSGTAGRPALAVLQGSGLGDAVMVITRYFGGTKLGTGGLVRAYSDAARAVIDAAPRAQKIATHTVALSIPYHLFERMQILLANHGAQLMEKTFTEDVSLIVRLPQDDLETFAHAVQELTRGQCDPRVVASDEETILPLPHYRS